MYIIQVEYQCNFTLFCDKICLNAYKELRTVSILYYKLSLNLFE